MKTIQEENSGGIMMSGDSPTPCSNHMLELKETLIGPTINNPKIMLDKEVQFDPVDYTNEPVPSKSFHQTHATQEVNPNQQSTVAESVVQANAISPVGVVFDKTEGITLPLSKKTETNKPEEEIETVVDHTDGPSEQLKNVKPEQEDSCLVNCLYYFDQCCECTIL